ncbi:MAG: NADP-dependent oxidoreductase [Magnetovibrio sp.]|nr:NADP-dependent oxidoreductase [Magnetovibrio sp.]
MWTNTRQVILKSRPDGPVKRSNFEIRKKKLRELGDGDVLVRTIYMSLDPYMRGRMDSARSYAANFEVGAPMIAGSVGEVLESKNDDYSAGDVVVGMLDWADYSIITDNGGLRVVNPEVAPLPYHLGVLGMPGLTAWIGIKEIGKPKKGETLFVSAASGGVGQIAGQMGRIAGCRVVGCAGSQEKVSYLINKIGFDAAFNHREEIDYRDALERDCPEGIDVNFENIGGAMLEAVLEHANNFARSIQCGAVSQYNIPKDQRYGVRNLEHVHRKRIRMEGFIVTDYWSRLDEFVKEMCRWLSSGAITYRVDIVDGLENAPEAFINMLDGANFGKQVVRVGDE